MTIHNMVISKAKRNNKIKTLFSLEEPGDLLKFMQQLSFKSKEKNSKIYFGI